MQEKFDRLYKLSKENSKFKKLMNIISDKDNILLAYRNIKKNKGSVTVGTDGKNIETYQNWNEDEFVKYFRDKLQSYNPKSVRRVNIPKPNGKLRPLGIPCMDDRIIQQCIKQVLESICEAKFHKHSYGFRPNRSTKHAIARSMTLANNAKCHYVVDIDIKGFFDNVNHAYFVRYADDFKIFCKDYITAKKIFIATTNWLKERLGLDISLEKSKITNLRKNKSEFLGIALYVKPSKNKLVCHSNISEKSKKRMVDNLKKQIKVIQRYPIRKEVRKLNSMILGIHNYYNCATKASYDFGDINFLVLKTLGNRLRKCKSKKGIRTATYEKLYGKYHGKLITVSGVTILPIYGCMYERLFSFKQVICNYTEEGRILIHQRIRSYNHIINYLLTVKQDNQSVEYNDNRISLMVGQRGKCALTGEPLDILDMECHHKKPKELGGTDEYKNLVWVKSTVHKLIHCSKQETINKYLNSIWLNEESMKKLNSLKRQVGNPII